MTRVQSFQPGQTARLEAAHCEGLAPGSAGRPVRIIEAHCDPEVNADARHARYLVRFVDGTRAFEVYDWMLGPENRK